MGILFYVRGRDWRCDLDADGRILDGHLEVAY